MMCNGPGAGVSRAPAVPSNASSSTVNRQMRSEPALKHRDDIARPYEGLPSRPALHRRPVRGAHDRSIPRRMPTRIDAISAHQNGPPVASDREIEHPGNAADNDTTVRASRAKALHFYATSSATLTLLLRVR